MKKVSKVVGALCSFFVSQVFALTLAETYSSSLNLHEKQMLEAVACKTPFGLKIQDFSVYTYQENAKEKHTVVVCESNGEFESHPTYNMAYCDNESNGWKCSERFVKVSLPVNNRSVELKFSELPSKKSYEALKKLSSLYFQSKSIDNLIGNSCTVYNGGSAEENEFSCSGGDMVVSYFCPTENCPKIIWIH